MAQDIIEWEDSVLETLDPIFGSEIVDLSHDVEDWLQEGFVDLLGIDIPEPPISAEGVLTTKTGSVQPMSLVYGSRRVGGGLIYLEASGTSNEYLWMVVQVADGDNPIEAIDDIFIDDVSYSDPKFSGFVSVEIVLGDQTGQPFPLLEAAAIGWTSDHHLYGTAAAAIKLTWSKDLFAGLPTLKFQVSGTKIPDLDALPTVTRRYSSNPAEALFDFLTNDVYGKGLSMVDGVDLDITSFQIARDYCDDSITSYSGGPPHTRMVCNLVLPTGRTALQNITELLQTCRGTLPYINGKFHLIIERHYTIADYGIGSYFNFNEYNVIGGWTIKSGDINARFNRVKLTYPNEDLDYASDFVVVESSTFRAADGRLLEKATSIPGISNTYRALDTASVILRKSRQQLSASFTATPKARSVVAGDIVTITHATPGWIDKQFRVTRLELQKTGNCGVSLVEHDSTVYDLSVPNEVNTSPDTNLPDPTSVPTLATPTLLSDETVLKIGADGTLVPHINVIWVAPTNIFVDGYDVEFKLSADSVWLAAGSPNSIATVEFNIPNVTEGSDYDVRVRAKNTAGFNGAWATVSSHTVIGKTSNPADVTNASSTANKDGIILSWDANTDLDINSYEIRVGGSSWSVGDSFVAEVDTTQLAIGTLDAGIATYRIKALDTGGRKSDNAVDMVAITSAPVAPIVSSEIQGKSVFLTWLAPIGTFSVASYDVSYTHPIRGLVSLGNTDGTIFILDVDWGGAATFRVSAVDIAGNVGAEGVEVVIVSSPSATSVTAQVIDNNVLLTWPDVPNTLPVEAYEVRKGAVYASAAVLAFQKGTFAALFENAAGSFVYWVTAVDTAGNFGTPASIAADVNQPPDFVLQSETIDDFSGSKTNVHLNGSGKLNFLVNTAETWEDHFLDNGWNSPQDQIDAGFPTYIQPVFNYTDTITDISSKQCTVTSTTGLSAGFVLRLWDMDVVGDEGIYTVDSVDSGTKFTVNEVITDESTATITAKAGSVYEKDIDTGGILNNLSITATVTGEILAGDPELFVQILTSEDDITYTAYAYGQTNVFVTAFRYVKVRLEVAGDSGEDLYEVSNLNIVINVKEITDAGTVAISGTGGTLVTFNKVFIDVSSITLSAGVAGAGHAALTPIYDFVDIPNPTTMEVRLYDSAGTEQASGTVGWNIRGH